MGILLKRLITQPKETQRIECCLLMMKFPTLHQDGIVRIEQAVMRLKRIRPFVDIAYQYETKSTPFQEATDSEKGWLVQVLNGFNFCLDIKNSRPRAC